MKSLIMTFPLLVLTFLVSCSGLQTKNEKRIQQLEDRIAIKELVDTFSNLADVKDIKTQIQLFTEDATVEATHNNKIVMTLKGRDQIGKAFENYLNLFETVYHTNGQLTLDINEDRATGTTYCLVVLIGDEKGKKMKTTSGFHYKDSYVRLNGHWLISKRTSTVSWTQKELMK